MRYVAITRVPVDCAASGYHFFARLALGPMTPPPDVWLDFFASADAICGLWHRFTATWWAERKRPNVLFMTFEDMKAQPEQAIERLAAYLGVDLTAAERTRVLDHTSFAAMKEINHKFYPVRQTIWSAREGEIIRAGKVGRGAALFSPGATTRFRREMSASLRRAGCDAAFYGLNTDKRSEMP